MVTTRDISGAGKKNPIKFPGSFMDKYGKFPIKALKVSEVESVMYTFKEKFDTTDENYYLVKNGNIVGAVKLGNAFEIDINQALIFTDKVFDDNFYGYVIKDVEYYDEDVKVNDTSDNIIISVENFLPENLIDIDVVKNVEERVVAAAVLVPDTVDLHGDIYTEETVKAAAYYFMEHYLDNNNGIDIMHDGNVRRNAIKLLQTFILEDKRKFKIELDIADNYSLKNKKNTITYPVGTWLIYARIIDDDLWDSVKSGELTGWSIAGLANTKELKKILDNSNKDANDE